MAYRLCIYYIPTGVTDVKKWLIEGIDRRPWLFGLILVVLIAVPGFSIYSIQDSKQDKLINCISIWADEITGRSSVLTEASRKRINAEDEVLRAAAAGNRTNVLEKLQLYVSASDFYNSELNRHPIPESPKLRCD